MNNNLKKLGYIFDGKQKRRLVFLGVLIFIGGILETLSVSALLPVVAALVDVDATMEKWYVRPILDAFGIHGSTQFIVALLSALIVIYIVKNAYLLLLVNVRTRFITYSKNTLISRVLREFLNRPYEFYLDADIPTVFRLTDSDIPNVFNMIMALISLASEAVVFVMICVVLVLKDWKMTLFLVAVMLVMTLLLTKILKPLLSRLGKKNQDIQSRIAKWRIEAIYGIKDVKVLHREAFFADNYESSGEIGAGIAKVYAVLNSLPRLLVETIFICSLLGYIMVYMLMGNELSALIETLTVFGAAAIRLMPCVNRINTYITEVAYAQPSLDYVYENLNMSAITRANDKTVKAKNPEVSISLKDKIELKGIEYAYPNTDTMIFAGADMVVPYGKSVGIMGPSGAGKSTIVDILLGLLRAKRGTITCDGVDIFENYPSWLAQIGYIPQSIYLVDEPVRNNIAFGISDDEIDDGRIWQALEEAQLKDFIETLPEGLDTAIGDRGVRLSGGQRQRLGIARALYHNPEILVFDEATSALDNETEAALMEAINSFHGKKTMIIIAHRLNTIEKCDIIYKVDKGKIVHTTLA
ncbi:MAG: ABC transporter ATP-binding protein/permease [Lachnospiraceae bacterium]|nr:ABC transporter ATP-binding protein/permease [Lachnospiraceae bacterium]